MKTVFKHILWNLSYMGIILIVSLSCGFAENDVLPSGLLPPPVEIKITMGSIPKVGEKAEVRIKVTPQEDMHADISCLLPEGIEFVREKGIIVRPCMERERLNLQQQTRYMEAVELWVGPLNKGIAKEFIFRAVIPDKRRYEFITRVEALAKWGFKEKSLVIDIN